MQLGCIEEAKLCKLSMEFHAFNGIGMHFCGGGGGGGVRFISDFWDLAKHWGGTAFALL